MKVSLAISKCKYFRLPHNFSSSLAQENSKFDLIRFSPANIRCMNEGVAYCGAGVQCSDFLVFSNHSQKINILYGDDDDDGADSVEYLREMMWSMLEKMEKGGDILRFFGRMC